VQFLGLTELGSERHCQLEDGDAIVDVAGISAGSILTTSRRFGETHASFPDQNL
jgi:hypothetical protein